MSEVINIACLGDSLATIIHIPCGSWDSRVLTALVFKSCCDIPRLVLLVFDYTAVSSAGAKERFSFESASDFCVLPARTPSTIAVFQRIRRRSLLRIRVRFAVTRDTADRR